MSKLNKNQLGFGAIEVLILTLVMAVVGFGGYYVWHTQHLNVTKTNTTTPASAKTPANSATQSGDSTRTGLVVNEWHIIVPVKTSDQFIATKSSQSDNADGSNPYIIYEVSTTAIQQSAKAIGCNDDEIGYILRTQTGNDGSGSPYTGNLAGNYYTFHSRSEAACVNKDGSSPEHLNTLMDAAARAFTAAFPQTSASN